MLKRLETVPIQQNPQNKGSRRAWYRPTYVYAHPKREFRPPPFPGPNTVYRNIHKIVHRFKKF